MSTRDRIEEAVEEVLKEIAAAIDDEDITDQARNDMIRLYAAIDHKLQKFNRPTGPDHTDGGPTRDDLEGVVTHGS